MLHCEAVKDLRDSRGHAPETSGVPNLRTTGGRRFLSLHLRAVVGWGGKLLPSCLVPPKLSLRDPDLASLTSYA